jgi:heme/copper-type cytochrome/quinol oxidase subunit 1
MFDNLKKYIYFAFAWHCVFGKFQFNFYSQALVKVFDKYREEIQGKMKEEMAKFKVFSDIFDLILIFKFIFLKMVFAKKLKQSEKKAEMANNQVKLNLGVNCYSSNC